MPVASAIRCSACVEALCVGEVCGWAGVAQRGEVEGMDFDGLIGHQDLVAGVTDFDCSSHADRSGRE